MNDFGRDIKGLQGVFRKRHFGPSATMQKRTRAFMCEGGPGCDPDPARGRRINGYWITDKMKDAISSSDLECVVDEKGREIKIREEEPYIL
jgi:hypothetical protein